MAVYPLPSAHRSPCVLWATVSAYPSDDGLLDSNEMPQLGASREVGVRTPHRKWQCCLSSICVRLQQMPLVLAPHPSFMSHAPGGGPKGEDWFEMTIHKKKLHKSFFESPPQQVQAVLHNTSKAIQSVLSSILIPACPFVVFFMKAKSDCYASKILGIVERWNPKQATWVYWIWSCGLCAFSFATHCCLTCEHRWAAWSYQSSVDWLDISRLTSVDPPDTNVLCPFFLHQSKVRWWRAVKVWVPGSEATIKSFSQASGRTSPGAYLQQQRCLRVTLCVRHSVHVWPSLTESAVPFGFLATQPKKIYIQSHTQKWFTIPHEQIIHSFTMMPMR